MQTKSKKGLEWRHRDPSRAESLLSAAADLFAAQGFHGTTVEQIATRAGVNRALVSYHFGGKKELYEAILERLADPVVRRLERLSHSSQPPARLLGEFMKSFASMAAHRPALPALLLRETLSPTGEQQGTSLLSSILSPLRRILEAGVTQGTFRHLEPSTVQLALLGSLALTMASQENLVRAGLWPSVLSTDEILVQLQELFTHGLSR